MEDAIFTDLTLFEINNLLGLPSNYDFLIHVEKYDNGYANKTRSNS